MRDEPVSDREYSISELEEATGTSRRTIHYYISRDLLPPADGSGLGARYREAHVLRLKAIDVLKGLSLRLDGVREVLNSMSADELRDTFEDADRHPSKAAYLLQHRMAQRTLAEFEEDVGEQDGAVPGTSEVSRGLLDKLSETLTGDAGVVREPESGPEMRYMGIQRGPRRDPQVHSSLDDATTWRRMQVTPDLEIHYRPGRDSRFTTKLREVVRLIRTLFGSEDPPPGGPK